MRVPLALACSALVVLCGLAARAQHRLSAFSSAPAQVEASQAAAQRALLRSRVDDELTLLRYAAGRGRLVDGSPAELVNRLEHIIGDRQGRAVLILHGDTLVSWAGTLHADPRALTGPSGVVATPFGLTLYAASDSAGVRAVAASLLY